MGSEIIFCKPSCMQTLIAYKLIHANVWNRMKVAVSNAFSMPEFSPVVA